MSNQTKKDSPAGNFEKAMSELEQIVESLESGQMPLEEVVQRFERGTALVEECGKILKDAEQKIKILEEGKLKDYKPVAQRGD